jgi:hypothetical protein
LVVNIGGIISIRYGIIHILQLVVAGAIMLAEVIHRVGAFGVA